MAFTKSGAEIGGAQPATALEAFEIREVGGQAVTIRLEGAGALPHPPFTLNGKHEIAKTRAMGSRHTIHQPTGAFEDTTEITGEWNDVFLGETTSLITRNSSTVIDGAQVATVDASLVTTARQLVDAVDDLRVRGVLLRVSWAHVVRLGRISSLTQRWKTTHDCEWDLTFDWTGPDEDIDVAPPENVDPSDDLRALDTATVAAFEATTFPIADTEPTVLEMIDRRIASLRSTVFEIEDAIRQRVDGSTSQVEVFRRTIGILGFVGEEAELLALEIDSRVAGTWIANVNPEDLTDVSPSKIMAVLTTKAKAARVARAARHMAVRRRYDHLAGVEEVAAIYVVREGEDLHSIARFHYGRDDAAELLRAYNHFDTYAPAVGTVVLAPRNREAAA